jgi:Stress responsive A/B Barrel Domain
LRHQVYFWLANPDSATDRNQLIAGLRTLAAIEQVLSLEIGIPADTEARDVVDGSFDVCETMRFAGTAEQKAYQDHPLHLAFVAQYSPLWQRVQVYDSVAV